MSMAFQRLRVESTLQRADEDQTPPFPGHPSPPRRGLTNTPASEEVSLVGARTPPAHELHAVAKPPRSDAGSHPSPDDPQGPTPGAQSFLNGSPSQGYQEDYSFDELEESSGYSTPGNPREMEDDQVNADLDHELFRTPPESFDQPSPNSPFLLNDIGSFIVYNSQGPVRTDASFYDILEGVHSTAGRVALKRPRIDLTDDTTFLREQSPATGIYILSALSSTMET
ncbi:hypothetical protein FRC00_002922 [Tulasnella sp. 408]|nr:hypothetical protein FRC00_002922 [Tulasnella sp. 408]